ncbi:MAG: aldo/keto reductase [Planctomycetes bacterium SM23_32]|nr:MAG: aldo/keto reductase [Planctomycetes bacterium SM23_32]
MKYRRLGSTEMRVSVVGVGAWQFGGDWGKDFTQDEVDAMLRRAKELGINLIDTSACYGRDHLSERLIGGVLEGDSREDWIIATKFGHLHGWTPAGVRRTLEESLEALGTDYVDLYQFHSGSDEDFDTPGLWEMLAEQVEAGKVRRLGDSIGWNGNTYQTGQAADKGFSAIQVVYNRLDRTPETEVLPLCEQQDLGVLARVPLASGFLSGKYEPGDTFPDNDVRSGREREDIDAQIREAQRIKAEEVPQGVEMAPWALAWCLKHPAVTCVIPGCKSVEQVESNAGAAELDIVSADHPQAWTD